MISALLLGILTACGTDNKKSGQGAGNQDSDTSIEVGLDPYNFSTMPAYLSKEILENNGYEVSIKRAQVGMLFQSLASGDIDAYIDIWAPTLQASYLKEYKGQFEFAGTLYSNAPIGIVVPKYMKKVNTVPDLKKYRAKFDGKIYAIEPGTGTSETTKKLIKAYNLDYKMVNSSEQGMLAAAKKKISANKPIAFQGWHPHLMFRMFDIKMLKDPKQVFPSDSVKIGVATDLKEKSPTAYTLFSNMSFSIDEVEKWLLKMENEGKDPETLAEEWVNNNKERVQKWLESKKENK